MRSIHELVWALVGVALIAVLLLLALRIAGEI